MTPHRPCLITERILDDLTRTVNTHPGPDYMYILSIIVQHRVHQPIFQTTRRILDNEQCRVIEELEELLSSAPN